MQLLSTAHGFTHWLTAHEAGGVWLTAIATVGLVVGVFVARRALEDSKTTRHAQLISDISKRWDSNAIVRARRRANVIGRDGLGALAEELFGVNAQKPANQASIDDWILVSRFPNLLETIGVMTRDKAVPARMVYQMWGPDIMGAAEQWVAATRILQTRSDPTTHRHFRWLAKKMNCERKKALEELRLEDPDNRAWFG